MLSKALLWKILSCVVSSTVLAIIFMYCNTSKGNIMPFVINLPLFLVSVIFVSYISQSLPHDQVMFLWLLEKQMVI